MSRIIIILLLLFFVTDVKAQIEAIEPWDFYNQIRNEANKRYSSSNEIINIDSLNKTIFKHGEAKMKMDTISDWMILFGYSNEGQSIIGQTFELPLYSDSIRTFDEIMLKSYVYLYDSSMVYSGSELFKGLEIDLRFLQADSTLQWFPIIFERHDELNHTWVPIISGDNLILRYVHSYPDGSMTSFYYEYILYFKKRE